MTDQIAALENAGHVAFTLKIILLLYRPTDTLEPLRWPL